MIVLVSSSWLRSPHRRKVLRPIIRPMQRVSHTSVTTGERCAREPAAAQLPQCGTGALSGAM